MTVQALRGHQPEVLDHLLATYGPEIQGVAYLILRDPSAAEDVVIDTLLTALDRGEQLRDATAIRAWLLRIATNRATLACDPRAPMYLDLPGPDRGIDYSTLRVRVGPGAAWEALLVQRPSASATPTPPWLRNQPPGHGTSVALCYPPHSGAGL